MARGKQRGHEQQTAAATAEDEQAELPKGAIVDVDSGRVLVPVDTVSSDEEEPAAAAATTDTVEEVLAGNYSPEIVDEVRKYGKAEWDQEPSSLDPIEDLETFYQYDFKLPPDAYDAYEAAVNIKNFELEQMKAPPDPATAAKIAQRKELVKGKTNEDIRWMKHKAYYRGIQKIRAGKAADQAAAEGAAAAAPPPSAADKQQQQQRLAHYSEDEVLAAVSEPSEWETGWTERGYQHHPEVLHELRSSFSAGLGLPPYKTAAQEAAEVEATWQQLKAAAAAAQQQQQQDEEAKQDIIAQYMPYQAYTPQYLERQKRQQQLATHRRTKQQAFWLSLGLALGSSAVRWWRRRGSSSSSKQRRRLAGGQQQSRQPSAAGSRRSTRPPTPSGMQFQGGIPE